MKRIIVLLVLAIGGISVHGDVEEDLKSLFIPPSFRGEDVESLCETIPVKDDFETTSQYKDRIANLLPDKTIIVRIPTRYFSYDADRQEIEVRAIDLDPLLGVDGSGFTWKIRGCIFKLTNGQLFGYPKNFQIIRPLRSRGVIQFILEPSLARKLKDSIDVLLIFRTDPVSLPNEYSLHHAIPVILLGIVIFNREEGNVLNAFEISPILDVSEVTPILATQVAPEKNNEVPEKTASLAASTPVDQATETQSSAERPASPQKTSSPLSTTNTKETHPGTPSPQSSTNKQSPPRPRNTQPTTISGDLKIICDTLESKGFISSYRLEHIPPPTDKNAIALTLTQVYGLDGYSEREGLLQTVTTFIRAKSNMPIRFYNWHGEVIAIVATGSEVVVFK